MAKHRSAFPNRLATVLAAGLLLSLASCSYFGWGGDTAGEATIKILVARPEATLAGSRALSGAGGTLQIPDFIAYSLKITAPDMDPISETNGTGSFSVKVPVSATINRLFSLSCKTTQALYSGSASQLVTGATTVSITASLDDHDLFVPVLKVTTGRVARVTLNAAGSILSTVDVQASKLRDPALAAYASPLSAPFNPGDCAVDAEGFLYLSDNLDAAIDPVSTVPRILKIRDANAAATVASDAFYIGTKAEAGAGTGISSMAIDRTRGIMYFARGGEAWFYRKSLIIDDGADQRKAASRVPLAPTGTMIALDCAPNGDLLVLRSSVGLNYLDRYAAPAAATDPPVYAATAATLPVNAIDLQVLGSYIYVLNPGGTGNVIQRYTLADLSLTPTSGGDQMTNLTGSGQFSSPSRFLTGPKGRVFVKVSVSGSAGVVSFTDLSAWAGWSYGDIGASLP